MAQPFSRRTRPPTAERSIRLLRAPTPSAPGIMAIKSPRLTHYYTFQELRCDIGGRAFAVHRLGLGNVYHVRVGAAAECSCECMGYLSRQRCKHILGLLALTGHGMV